MNEKEKKLLAKIKKLSSKNRKKDLAKLMLVYLKKNLQTRSKIVLCLEFRGEIQFTT